jgi:hypothetical protein
MEGGMYRADDGGLSELAGGAMDARRWSGEGPMGAADGFAGNALFETNRISVIRFHCTRLE